MRTNRGETDVDGPSRATVLRPGCETVEILLSTYQGSRFLASQIESLLAQTCHNWRLIVRDDGSTDATRAVIDQYVAKHGQRIRVVHDGAHLGACRSFARLMEHSRAEYVALCDQDDVWMPDKLARMMEEMKKAEGQSGKGRPVLVHSDLAVADERLAPVAASFWRHEGIDPEGGSLFRRLLAQNVVTGCAAMANRALIQRAMPIPRQAIMHDWWLALVASAFGSIRCLRETTVVYRQHGGNVVGASGRGLRLLCRRWRDCLGGQRAWSSFRATQVQAKAFQSRYGAHLATAERPALAAFASLRRHSFLARRLMLLKHGIRKHGWIRNVGMLVEA